MPAGGLRGIGGPVRDRRRGLRREPVAPQPPRVAAERLGKQGERDDESGLGRRSAAAGSTAAIVSTIPCVAATILRQKRGGSGARIHGSGHPAARNA